MILSSLVALMTLGLFGILGWKYSAHIHQRLHLHPAISPIQAANIAPSVPAISSSPPATTGLVSSRNTPVHAATMAMTQMDALHTVAESVDDAIVAVDAVGHIVYHNPAARRLAESDVGRHIACLHMIDGSIECLAADEADCPLRAALEGRSIQAVERYFHVHGDGIWLNINAQPFYNGEQQISGAIAIFRDVTSSRRAAIALKSSEERYMLALQASNDGVWDWDLRTNEVFYSSRWKDMVGHASNDIGDSPEEWFSRIHPDDREAVQTRLKAHILRLISKFEHEYRLEHRDGTYRWVACRGLAVWNNDGVAIRMVGSQTDITARKLAEQRLLHSAFHDHLTGLANRTLLLERLSHAIIRQQRQEQDFAVIAFDLDHFKVINDSLGLHAGDQLLQEVGRRIERCTRPGDTIARLSGDEFAILLENVPSPQSIEAIATCLLQRVTEPLKIDGHDIYTSASIGIAYAKGMHYQRADDMLRDASTALYQAKQQGRARFVIFDVSMHNRALARLQLDGELRRSIERDELRIHYQPIIEFASRRITGFEALVRWQHPTRGMVAPSDFIPIAEETGTIKMIGLWVLREALSQLSVWQRQFPADKPLTLNVNLSPRQFDQADLIHTIGTLINETMIDPGSLKLEITESALIEHADEASTLLHRLNDLGIGLCIDDFGTGYSSLSYLNRFPFRTLKIDKSFVRQLNANTETVEIVRTIIALARSLGMTTVAEGVETVEQMHLLNELACDHGQGWVFSRAIDAIAATELLERQV